MSVRQPEDEIDVLLNLLFDSARELLEGQGEFRPFGATIDGGGNVSIVSADDPSTGPEAAETVLGFLVDSLTRQAGALTASALCVDVMVTDPRGGFDTDAVRVSVEHRHADPVEVFMPYRRAAGTVTFGDVFAHRGYRRVFR